MGAAVCPGAGPRWKEEAWVLGPSTPERVPLGGDGERRGRAGAGGLHTARGGRQAGTRVVLLSGSTLHFTLLPGDDLVKTAEWRSVGLESQTLVPCVIPPDGKDRRAQNSV